MAGLGQPGRQEDRSVSEDAPFPPEKDAFSAPMSAYAKADSIKLPRLASRDDWTQWRMCLVGEVAIRDWKDLLSAPAHERPTASAEQRQMAVLQLAICYLLSCDVF